MGSIYDISKLSSEIDKNSRKKINKNTNNLHVDKSQVKVDNTAVAKDRADISEDSVKLFNMQKESKKYVDMIKNVHLVSEKQLQELKENVLSDFYSENDVVEAIAEKMVSMSNFKN